MEEGPTATSETPQESALQVHEASSAPALEDVQPNNILSNLSSATKPVKITIINPLGVTNIALFTTLI